MKNLLPLFTLCLCLSLFSCEKEDTKIVDSSSNEPIVGNWGPWVIREYLFDQSLNGNLMGIEMWGDSKVEFKSDNTVNHTISGNFNAAGNYVISGKKIKISLSNGVQNINGNALNILNPNSYSGFIDTLDSKKIVFRDSVFYSNGNFIVRTYSANRIK